MILAVGDHYVLPANVPPAAVWLGAAVACAAWAAMRFVPRPAARWRRTVIALARLAVGSGAMLAAGQALQTVVLFATDWPVWPLAVAMAAAVEITLGLYALERKTVPRRTGFALAALRVALVLVVLAMLAQPVRSVQWSEKTTRAVAVLLDNSASMLVRDAQEPWEKVRLAETLGAAGVSRPYRLERAESELAALRDRLAEPIEWMDQLKAASPEARNRTLLERRPALHKALAAAITTIDEQVKAISPQQARGLKLDAATLAAMEDVRTLLSVRAGETLKEAAALADPAGKADLVPLRGRVLDCLRRTQAALTELLPKVQSLGRSLDETYYASLTALQRQQVDTAVHKSRLELARALLLSPASADKQAESVLDHLRKQYDLRAYEFASSCGEVDASGWASLAGPPAGGPTASARSGPSSVPALGQVMLEANDPTQETNLAGALQKVLADIPADRLAGVLILSDGRHNALGQDVESQVHRLASLGVKVSSVVMGAGRPPTDGAIVSVDVPEAVYAKDRMYVTAELKLDGLAGRKVKVALLDDANQEVDANTIAVPSESFRARVQLADTPQKAGFRSYRVVLQGLPEEAFASNNEYAFSVGVTDDQVRMLLIEGRPRWEFRYLKNLFATRDRTVRLQYVLFEPDPIPDVPPPPAVAASATAPEGVVQATALPDSPAEWMKFDVVVLGDVPPASLRPQDQEALRRFVTDRGGTLIVVAGQSFMPRAYAASPLADILPVTWTAAGPARANSSESFRIGLTTEGRQNVILRLAVDPKENDRLWESMPQIEWRLRDLRAKPGAAVLAYAMPVPPPPVLSPRDPNQKIDPEALRRFQNDNALVVQQSAGMGEVLLLTFDHTWRLRYRTGDSYHHKFWGQVLRWATANKLPSGTNLVKIGADRARYWPGQRVHIRSRIVAQDLSPVRSTEVAVKVYQGQNLLARRPMEYRPDSPGMYLADLGPLPAGQYRVELDAPAARDILASEGAQTVATEFSVMASTPAEQIELSADRGLLGAIADWTGGVLVEEPQIAEAALRMGPSELLRPPQRKEYVLWNHWPLLVFILIAATAEWLLRKKVGLA